MADRQWEELDGTPSLVIDKGERYQRIAEAIQRSTGALQAITDEIETKSLAMDAIRKLASDVREDIDKAQTRYSETGAALVEYGNALKAAKEEADPAAAQLRTLREDLADAQRRERAANDAVADLSPDATPDQRAEAQRSATTAGGAVSSIQSQITTYENQWTRGDQAKNGPDGAAAHAMSRIQEVVTGSRNNGLEDSGWDKFGEVWDKLSGFVKAICDVAGILAIFFAWVPFLGQVLVVLAAVGALLSVLESVVAYAKGEGSLLDVFKAAGWAALTLLGGKVVGTLAKFVKAKSVVRVADTMTRKQSRLRFGRSVIKDARATVGTSKGRHAWNTLKSPFARSSKAKDALKEFKRNPSWENFRRQTAKATDDAFPKRYTDAAGRQKLWPQSRADWQDVGRRLLYKSDDVAESHALKEKGALKGESKYVFQGADARAMNAVRVAAVGVNAANVYHAQDVATDAWGSANQGAKITEGVASGFGIPGKASSAVRNTIDGVAGLQQ